MSTTNRRTLRRVKLYDWLARWVVTFGGVVVIVCVLAILVSIVATALPLFYSARPRLLGEADLPGGIKPEGVLALGIQSAADDSWLIAHVVDGTGKFRFVDLRKQELIGKADAAPPNTSMEQGAGSRGERLAPLSLLGATPVGRVRFHAAMVRRCCVARPRRCQSGAGRPSPENSQTFGRDRRCDPAGKRI